MLEPATKRKENSWKSELPRTVTTEPTIQLQFFKDGKVQHVRIVTAGEINLEEVIQHLQQGESILIIRKRASEEKTAFNVDEEMSRPWYFTHF